VRWPIRTQLLLWMLGVVGLGIVLTTLASAWLAVADASRRQAAQLRRVVATTTEPPFPLTESVLLQMRGLSGGEFVLLDRQRNVLHSTIELAGADLAQVQAAHVEATADPMSAASVLRLADRSYFAELVPIRRAGGTEAPCWLLVLYPKDRWWSVAREVARPIVAAGLVTMLLGGLAAAWVAARLSRPIRTIGAKSAVIAAGRFEPIALPPRNDEIGDLATSINTMSDQLSHFEEEVRRTERLRTLGQLGAGMAHQLRNAATGIRMAVELHQRECPAAAESESTAVALRELRLMESYLRSFLELGREPRLPRERVELGSIVRGAVELVRPTCRHAQIDLDVRLSEEPIPLEADEESLRQLLVNLLLNAAEAVSRRGVEPARIVVELERPEAARAVIRVQDSGPGPSPTVQERLFEPFVTEKPDGTGLGLYVARQIVQAHGGSIGWERRDGMTCFRVELALGAVASDPTED